MKGSELQALRINISMSQEQLAASLGTYQPSISRWEIGSHVPEVVSLAVNYLLLERSREQIRTASRDLLGVLGKNAS
jgi:DNA-binding transcriptional regulator YiaG